MTTTQSTTPRIYPGLTDSSVEFWNHDDETKVLSQGKVTDFYDTPISILLLIREQLSKEHDTDAQLKEWHPESEMKRMEKFVRCRYGGLDFKPDVINLQLQAGEYWPCPLRGKCRGEGIVCKNAVYNNQELTGKDIKLIQLLSTNLTNEALADKFKMCMGTFNLFKKELYKKLNIQTKQEAVLVAVELNLL